MNDYDYMKVALKQAKIAYKKGEVPVGSIVVEKGKIISKAYNLKETKNCALYHAELISLRKATHKKKNWRLNECTMYVTLKPCPMCASAIKQSRIKKVVYLLDNNNMQNNNLTDEIFKTIDSNKTVEIVKLNIDLFDDNEVKLLEKFFYKKRQYKRMFEMKE